MSAVSLFCWGPIPLACLWIGSEVDYLSGSVFLGILIAFLALFPLLFGALLVLLHLDHAWILVRRAAGHDQRTGAMVRIFGCTAAVCRGSPSYSGSSSSMALDRSSPPAAGKTPAGRDRAEARCGQLNARPRLALRVGCERLVGAPGSRSLGTSFERERPRRPGAWLILAMRESAVGQPRRLSFVPRASLSPGLAGLPGTSQPGSRAPASKASANCGTKASGTTASRRTASRRCYVT